MKTKIIQIILLLSCWSTAWAQPANDDCANAYQLEFANSEAEVIHVDGDTRGAIASTAPSNVCSQSFYTDDVWYKFTTPSILPDGGIVIKAYFDNIVSPTDLPHVGMAVYAGCGMDEVLVSCYVDDDPELNKMELPVPCLVADQEYLVRIWSGGADSSTEGTFRIGAFAGLPITDIFWWETFGGGLEANGWTTEGYCAFADSNHNAGWKYLPDGLVDKGAFIFAGAAISSSTLCDGAVGVDSDYNDNYGNETSSVGPCNNPAQHILISPIIFSGGWIGPVLWLTWTQAIRQFQSTYIFSYRIRDENTVWSDWIDQQVNMEMVVNGDFLSNDFQRVSLNGALGRDSLQIRFIYNSNYYMWAIDDVKIEGSLIPCNDLNIDRRNYAIAPFAIYPSNQINPFPASVYLKNNGTCAQQDAKVELMIKSLTTADTVFNEEITIDTISPGDRAYVLFPELVEFPFYPDDYQLQYKLTLDSINPPPNPDYIVFNFQIGGNTFALEDRFTRSVAVANSIYDKGAPLSYAYGNYFKPSTTTCADRIVWGVNNPDEMKDHTVQVYLLEWSDLNQNQIAESNERKFVGFDDYTFSGDEGENAIIETSLENFESPGFPIMMDAGHGYMAIIEYQATSEDDPQFFILASEERDYIGQQIASDSAFAQGLIDRPSYFSVLGFSPNGDISNIDYEVKELDFNDDRIFFGNDIVPLVRVITNEKGCIVGLEELSSTEKISVFPNPVNESLHVKLEFTSQHHDVQVNLINSLGQRIMTRTLHSSVFSHTEKFDVRDLVAGSYHIQVETSEGQRTIPVVILH